MLSVIVMSWESLSSQDRKRRVVLEVEEFPSDPSRFTIHRSRFTIIPNPVHGWTKLNLASTSLRKEMSRIAHEGVALAMDQNTSLSWKTPSKKSHLKKSLLHSQLIEKLSKFYFDAPVKFLKLRTFASFNIEIFSSRFSKTRIASETKSRLIELSLLAPGSWCGYITALWEKFIRKLRGSLLATVQKVIGVMHTKWK